MSDEKLENLDEMLHQRVTSFVRRALDHLDSDGCQVAEMKIRLHTQQWDDDETPVLDADVEETFHVTELTGRVPAEKASR